jgi:hypothetical protein
MIQRTYRILPQSVILYGVEMTEPDKAPRVLLTCSTEAAATAWILEIERLSAAKFDTGGRNSQHGRPSWRLRSPIPARPLRRRQSNTIC